MSTKSSLLQDKTLTVDDIYTLQEAVLATCTARNSKLKFSAISERNKQLETCTKTVIGAINELARRINAETSSNKKVIIALLKLVGDPYLHENLIQQVFSRSSSLTRLVLDMNDDFKRIKNQVKTTYHELYTVDDKCQTDNYTFKLDHTPVKETVKVIMNSLMYVEGFNVDVSNRTVQWTALRTGNNEDGFTPELGTRVLIEYVGLLQEED